MEQIAVYPAQAHHLDAVYALMVELEGLSLDREAFLKVYAANLAAQNIRYLLAFLSGQPVGFISLHVQRLLHHTGLVGEIQELVVKEGLRGRGLGQVLFQAAREAAQVLGCIQLEVCCRQTREQSHAFYQRMGMTSSHFKLCLPLVGDA